ncbi:MAG: response regulator [Geobacter sp.]|nr:response regulator [Geobacter sp.]
MKRITLVDDSRITQMIIKGVLSENYEMDLQENGLDGIAAIKKFMPDLVLLDIHLPDIDGYEVCRVLKNDEKTRDIPIIFITSMDSVQERVKGFEAGSEDYVVKPFYPQELLARVKAHLATRSAKAQAVEVGRLMVFREMAVALSHEINNPLTALYAFLHVLWRETGNPGEMAAGSLMGMQAELDRIRRITEKLGQASQLAETRYNHEITMVDICNI